MTAPDPFNTGKLRSTTLQIWQDNPARFREDANTEEDYARGYYRDRVVIELAQNAADAAHDSGGSVHFSLHSDTQSPSGFSLTVANTGNPLTADGVASLSGLRTSAKRDQGNGSSSIGHFGVGFSAVRAVSDEIIVRSAGGGARFSLARVDAALHELGAGEALAAEIARRGSELPILRLPWPEEGLLSEDVATQITVRLRDAQAVIEVERLLAEIDDELLIALPRLEEIRVAIRDEEPRIFAEIDERWIITRREGRVPDELISTLPVEERERAGWAITWASPRGEVEAASSLLEAIARDEQARLTRRTLFAPTPTDEPVTVPGFLIVTVPLEPTRRRVRPGPVTDWVLQQAGEVAAEHARALEDPLVLVPIGLPAGEVDAALHASTREALSRATLLRTLDGAAIAPRDATAIVLTAGANDSLAGATPVIDRRALTELASGLQGIVDVPRHRLAHADALGVTALNVADVITEIPAGRTPARWHETYENLSALSREIGGLGALASMPVPLADGRVVSGARGAFVINDDVPAEILARICEWGLRVVAPGAQHGLLESLGATPTYAGQLLDEPETREHLDDSDAILHLVSSAVAHTRQSDIEGPIRPWLPDLPLPVADGGMVGAGGIALDDSEAVELFLNDEVDLLDFEEAQKWPAEVWRAVGVRDTLVTVRQTVTLDAWNVDAGIDAALDDASIGILDRLDDYLDELADYWLEADDDGADVLTFELVALADLDIVKNDRRADAQERVVEWLKENEQPVTVPGRDEPFAHYTRWWLETMQTGLH